jgi:hypothetical protein
MKNQFPSREEFRKWLEAKPKHIPVGKAWVPNVCPLSNWLNYIVGPCIPADRRPTTTDDWWWNSGTSSVYPSKYLYHSRWWAPGFRPNQRLPKWANDFALIVDENYEKRSFISADISLRLLCSEKSSRNRQRY